MTGRIAMNLGQRTPDVRVTQPGEPIQAVGWQRLEVTTNDIHEHQFAQATEDALTTDPWLLRLRQCDPHIGAERTIQLIAYLEQMRQCVQQRVERARVAAEEPADEPGRLGRATSHGDRNRQLLLIWRTVALDVVVAAQARGAREHMSVAVGDYHHVY